MGITDTFFDADLITHINSVISILTQLGVGPSEGFTIEGPNETWSQFIGDDPKLSSVRTYIFTKTKLMFDPPASGTISDAMKTIANELEFRLQVESEMINDRRYNNA